MSFEEKFSGGKGTMVIYQVAWFVLKVNYQDFFDALLPEGAMGRAREAILNRVVGAETVTA